MTYYLELLIGALVLGSIYALVSVGFVVLFRGTRVMNFAQGNFMLLGAFLLYTAVHTWRLPYGVAIALGAVGVAAVGAVVFQFVLARVDALTPFSASVGTIALATIVSAVVQLVWGTRSRPVPHFLDQHTLRFARGVAINGNDLFIVGCAAVVLTALGLVLQRTTIGIRMRAAVDNPVAAVYVLGVRVRRMSVLAWTISGALSGLAGLCYALHVQVDVATIPALGLGVFPAVLLGGVDSILGAVIGSFVIALGQAELTNVAGGDVATASSYGLLLLVVCVRPAGLLGRRETARV